MLCGALTPNNYTIWKITSGATVIRPLLPRETQAMPKATKNPAPKPSTPLEVEVKNPRYEGATPGMVARAMARPLRLKRAERERADAQRCAKTATAQSST